MHPWWLDPKDDTPNDRIPVYTDETGWAKFDKKIEFIDPYVRVDLIPIVADDMYTRRAVRLYKQPARDLEVVDKKDRLGRLRLLSPIGTLRLMLDIVKLEGPPVDRAPFSHGARETRFTTNELYRDTTRKVKYQKARRTGDPIDYARALRDLAIQHRMHGKRSLEEYDTLARMTNELVYEVFHTYPPPRAVKTDQDRARWARQFVYEIVGLKEVK